MTDELLTTEETANYLKISKRTLFRMIHKGKIRAIKLGNTYRFRRIEIDKDLGSEIGLSTEAKRVQSREMAHIAFMTQGMNKKGYIEAEKTE